MTWDYYVLCARDVEININHYHQRLSVLEEQLRNSRGRERREIRRQIEEVKQRLRTIWKQELRDDTYDVLIAQFIDNVSIWWFRENFPRKEDARTEIYMPITQELTINEPGRMSDEVDFRPNFQNLPTQSWVAFQIDFELLTPWYSRDDRIFHVMDNPVRKDRVFGVPYMAASSWKGMLRWACRMHAGLREHLEKHNGKMDGWRDPEWILHLFGNEKGEEKDFHRGALVFYPTWFDKIGFEVINPHSRERRAGTQPIYYEVVPPGAKGTLSLLYAPWPGMKPVAKPAEVWPKFLEAIEALLTTYGISAKRTVGWGTARIDKWRAFHKTYGSTEKDAREDLQAEIQAWLPSGGTP